MKRVTLNELLVATNGKPVGIDRLDVAAAGISIDSRTLVAGDVFWALQGERHNGHNHVSEAQARGAVASVVSRNRADVTSGPSIVVDDTLTALHRYAAWHRSQHCVLVIGVTGSVGKTTTRSMIHAVLESQHHGIQSPKNYNNHVGLPLSVLGIEPHHEFGVFELGASRVGEIRELSQICAPDIGVITNVGIAHLAEFGDESGIMQAKSELIESLPDTGFAVLPGDDVRMYALAERAPCPVILVGEGYRNSIRATNVQVGRGQLQFRVEGHNYTVAATGRQHIVPSLAAIAIGLELGLQPDEIDQGLQAFTPVAGRSQLLEIGPWTVIDDTYNANPTSMHAACNLLRDWDGFDKRILIAGSMLELGDRAAELHREFGRNAAASALDHVLVYGEHSDNVVEGAVEAGMPVHQLARCEDFDSLTANLDCCLTDGAILLVKGSRSMRMERVIEWLRGRATQRHTMKLAGTSQALCIAD